MGRSSIDINGFRDQEANPISMVGVFPYTGKQIDYDGSYRLNPTQIYWVFRSPQELFAPEAIKSFNGLPIRVGHVMLGKGFASVDKEPIDGAIFNVRQSLDQPEYLIADFKIYTDKMQDILKQGKIKELSLGYRCQYVKESGVYNGTPYEFKQANLRGNHLALVEHGRCGSSVRVCDEAILTFDSLPKEIIEMDNEKKRTAVKALANAMRSGDTQTCQDALDFVTQFSPEERKEALEALKAKKDAKKDEPKAEDAKCSGNKAKDEIPPPPPIEKKPEEAKPAEEPAPAPAPAPTPAAAAPAEPPAASAPKPEDAPVAADKKGGKSAKDEAPATVTTPSIPTPVAGHLDGTKEEKKDEPKVEDKKTSKAEDGCGEGEEKSEKKDDAEPKSEDKKPEEVIAGEVTETVVEKPEDKKEEPKTEDKKPEEAEVSVEELIEAAKPEPKGEDKAICPNCGKDAKTCDCGVKEPKAEDKKDTDEGCAFCETEAKGEKKTEDGGITKEPMGGAPKPFPEKKESFGEDGVTSEVYAKVAAEYDRAQKMAAAVKEMGVTLDSAGKREIEIAREAIKQIPSLAFAVDAADEAVLTAVRGAIAGRADKLARGPQKVFSMKDSAVAQDSAPKASDPNLVIKALWGIKK